MIYKIKSQFKLAYHRLSGGRSVNPIRTGEGRLSPPITTDPLNVFHLPAALLILYMHYSAVGPVLMLPMPHLYVVCTPPFRQFFIYLVVVK